VIVAAVAKIAVNKICFSFILHPNIYKI